MASLLYERENCGGDGEDAPHQKQIYINPRNRYRLQELAQPQYVITAFISKSVEIQKKSHRRCLLSDYKELAHFTLLFRRRLQKYTKIYVQRTCIAINCFAHQTFCLSAIFVAVVLIKRGASRRSLSLQRNDAEFQLSFTLLDSFFPETTFDKVSGVLVP